MSNYPFVSNNPFRILGIASSTPLRDLRQKASSAEIAARVGMAPEPGLAALFGADELNYCVTNVKALAVNPVELTLHRLFWPIDLDPEVGEIRSLENLDSLLNAPVASKAYNGVQVAFLISWFECLLEFDPALYKEALKNLASLCEEATSSELLRAILEADGESPEKAATSVCEAKKQAMGLLLAEGCKNAVDCWDKRDYDGSIALFKTMCDSKSDEEVLDSALQVIVPFFDREVSALKEITDKFENWSPGDEQFDASVLEPYRKLVTSLNKRVPSAGLWGSSIDECIVAVAGQMRSRAIDLANEHKDFEKSGAVLRQIQTLPLPQEFKDLIDGDLDSLTNIDKHAAEWEGIKPITGTPSLTTINGCGFKLYGKGNFEPRPEWYYATLYFVLLYIPIVPVKRYVVSRAPSGGWYFHATAKFTKGHKVHLWSSLATILLIVIVGITSSSTSGGDVGSDSGHALPYGSGYHDPDTQARIDKLTNEYNQLAAVAGPEETALKKEEAALDQEGTAIEQEKKDVSKKDKMQKDIEAYNKRVDSLSKRANTYNLKAVRLNDIQKALRDLGN